MFIHHQALHYLSADVLTFKFKFLSCLRSSGTIERVVQNISTISVRGINVYFFHLFPLWTILLVGLVTPFGLQLKCNRLYLNILVWYGFCITCGLAEDGFCFYYRPESVLHDFPNWGSIRCVNCVLWVFLNWAQTLKSIEHFIAIQLS